MTNAQTAFRMAYRAARAAVRNSPVIVARAVDLQGRPRFDVRECAPFHQGMPEIWIGRMYEVLGAKHAPEQPNLAERLEQYKADKHGEWLGHDDFNYDA